MVTLDPTFSFILSMAMTGGGLLVYYFWELRNMFPVREIKKGGKPLAFFIDKAGQLKIIRMDMQKGRLYHTPFGTYQARSDWKYTPLGGKRDVYFPHLDNANPISVEGVARISDALTRLKSPKLSVSDVKSIGANARLCELIGPDALKFIDTFYENDKFAKADIINEAATRKNFKLPMSSGLIAFIPQRALFWRTVAIVIINNRYLDFDHAKLLHEVDEKGDPLTILETAKYGRFEIKDARTTIRKGKTRIYIITVREMKAN